MRIYISLILFGYFLFCYSYLFVVPSFLVNQNKDISSTGLELSQTFIAYILDNETNKYKISGNYMPSNKVDIIMGNHISYMDFLIMIGLLKQHNKTKFHFMMKDIIKYIPGMGIITVGGINMHLSREYDKDKELISKTIDNIKDGSVIIIFPEGTIKTKKNYQESIKYGIENNLPFYKNLLIPRYKGLELIVSELEKKHKMGSIVDLTIIDRHLILNDFKYDVDNFKQSLYKYWEFKDKIFDEYKELEYKDIEFSKYNTKLDYIMIGIIMSCGLNILTSKLGIIYFLVSIIYSYIYIFMFHKRKTS